MVIVGPRGGGGSAEQSGDGNYHGQSRHPSGQRHNPSDTDERFAALAPCAYIAGGRGALAVHASNASGYRARGSGRSWNLTTLLVVPFPPSTWNGVRVAYVEYRPLPFQPASGS